MRVIVHGSQEDDNNQFKDGIIDVYARMHELARHVIHFQETIEAAKTSLEQMVESGEQICNGCCTSRLKRWAGIVRNLKPRADGFMKRLRNEISLAYNTVNAQQLRESRSLLEENTRDGKDISWMVGFLSIIFLPGTFVSGFFSMTFFDSENGNVWWHRTRNVWLYFAGTIPLTIIGLVTLWHRHSRAQRVHFARHDLECKRV